VLKFLIALGWLIAYVNNSTCGSTKDHLKSIVLAGLMILMATEANAMTTALGKPVESVGSNVQAVSSCGSGACYNTGTGTIGFYIRLNSADNGTYGIDIDGAGPKGEAGTFSDSKAGPFTNASALTMYLRFTPLAPFHSHLPS
jgi:hypothetical protein